MENIGNISILGLIFGMIGTTLGGFLGAFLNINSNKFVSFVLEFAAGLMTAVICFDLIPESLGIVGISICILGIFLGTICMIFCQKKVDIKYSTDKSSNSLIKTGIIIFIGLAIHNFPEGLAIGAGFDVSNTLRYFTCNSYSLA